MANKSLENKLNNLPKSPGVYFYKDKSGEIIYVGKAAVLKNRVKQYFQKSRARDTKTEALISEITDLDWMEVDSELDALFLEAEMVRRYMPRYNILLRDDKSMVYVRIDYDSGYPTVSTTRRPLDDGARYFGPYLSAVSVRQALKFLRRVFPYAVKRVGGQRRASLHYHLGLDPGLEEGKTSLSDYRANLRKLMAVLEGKRKNIEKQVEKEMKHYANVADFESAAKARNQLFALSNLGKQVIFSEREFLEISKDHALSELVELLGLSKFPVRIEGYDISHMSGTDVVASMVVFTNGVSNKTEYRKFKMIERNDDFANMHQTIKRRFKEANVKKWGLPDLILIDGGKGQLSSAQKAMQEMGVFIPAIGLAKKQERIIVSDKDSSIKVNTDKCANLLTIVSKFAHFTELELPQSSHIVKLLQRIRDESHRFAVSYHSTLKSKRQTASVLDEIPGIGPVTRKKLIKTFGSVRGVQQATQIELEKILGAERATNLRQNLK